MNPRTPNSFKAATLIPTTYAPLLAELKARVRAAQMKSALAVNRELILLYWHIGREILRAQKAEGWGTKVVERLAKDLASEFPEMSGFSPLNLKRMKAFYEAWAPIEIVQQAVGQLPGPIVSRAVTQLDEAEPKPGKPRKVQQPVAQLSAEVVSQPVTQFEDEPPGPLAMLS